MSDPRTLLARPTACPAHGPGCRVWASIQTGPVPAVEIVGDHVTDPPRVLTWADGFGRWYAAVPIDRTMPAESRGDRMRARAAIRDEIAEREQRSGETWREVRSRIRPPRVEPAPDYWSRPGFVVFRETWSDQ